MEEDITWVPVTNYELDRKLIKQYLKQDEPITKEKVKIRFHELLEKEDIPYKNKLTEACNTKIPRRPRLFNNHYLCVEVYVPENLEEKAIKIIRENEEEEDLWKKI